MKRAFQTSLLAIALVASSLVFTGCRNEFTRAEFVFLNGAEPETLDPALITGQPEGRIANALFEGLTRFDEKGLPVPGVAERWDISPDRKVYTFHLRDNARWSNGTPVTADDFARSWERTLNPATGSSYASQLFFILNAKEYNEGKLTDFSKVGVRVIDPRTLEVTLTNPTTFFLDLCAFITLAPVPIDVVQKYGDDWTKPGKMVSNGAYTLTSWRLNDHIRLTKNPFYWNRDKVALNTVDALPTANANTAFNFYDTGLADLLMDKGLVPTPLLDALKKRPDFHSAPFLGTYFLRFNCTRPPFNDPRVRKAFALVVDKPLIVEKITRAGERPARSLVPPGTGGYTPPEGPMLQLEQARQLLADAGYPGGKGFPLVRYLYSAGQVNEAIAVEIQAMLKRELGVYIELERQEWKVYLNSMTNLDYDMCRASWIGDYNDPFTFLSIFTTDDGNNRTGWSNAEFDALIAATAREPDPQKRFELFRKAETILYSEDVPIVPLYFYEGIMLYDDRRIGGIEANLLDEHPIQAIYLRKKKQ